MTDRWLHALTFSVQLQLSVRKSATKTNCMKTGVDFVWISRWYSLTQAEVKVVCEAGGGSPDDAKLEQTSYPFQPH